MQLVTDVSIALIVASLATMMLAAAALTVVAAWHVLKRKRDDR